MDLLHGNLSIGAPNETEKKSLMNWIGFEPTATGFALYAASQGLDMSSKVINSADIFGRGKKDRFF